MITPSLMFVQRAIATAIITAAGCTAVHRQPAVEATRPSVVDSEVLHRILSEELREQGYPEARNLTGKPFPNWVFDGPVDRGRVQGAYIWVTAPIDTKVDVIDLRWGMELHPLCGNDSDAHLVRSVPLSEIDGDVHVAINRTNERLAKLTERPRTLRLAPCDLARAGLN